MKLQALAPMLRTPDVPASVAFYRDILGFACDSGGSDGWATLRRDGVEIMLASPHPHEGNGVPAFTGSLYLRTDDVDGWWNRLKDAARVCYPVENFRYGMREFAVYDNNGYLLQFGQPLREGATIDCKE